MDWLLKITRRTLQGFPPLIPSDMLWTTSLKNKADHTRCVETPKTENRLLSRGNLREICNGLGPG